jgi:death-on-curing protein
VTRYVSLAEYFWLAEQVTGVDADSLAKAARSDLADSALHTPEAGFGVTDFRNRVPAIRQRVRRRRAHARSR